MTLDSAQAIFLTLAFIVPGFIIDSVYSKFVTRQRPESHVAFLRYLTFSCLNYALWCWLVYWVVFEKPSVKAAFLCWALVTMVSPVAIALLLSYTHQKKWLGWLAGRVLSCAHRNKWFGSLVDKVKLRTIHATPTAWDYVFSRQESSFVQITLASGARIRGIYSSRSFSS